MTYSMYIGRVGALAVALGIGAAVATSPGIAFAQDGDGGQSNTGTESPSDESPGDPGPQTPAAGDGAGGGGTDGEAGAGGTDIDPPDMQVSGSTVDTGTHDDNIGAGEGVGTDDNVEGQAEGGVDEVEGTDELGGEIDGEAPADENGSGSGGSGLPGTQGSGPGGPGLTPPNTQNIQHQLASNTGFTNRLSGAQRLAGGGVDYDTTDTDNQSFKTTALDNSTVAAETFSALALAEAAPAPQSPISALLALPLRLVSDVLTAIVGGPNTPPGENPLFLGLLAFVRRQFAPFERTFSNQAPVITVSSVGEESDGTFTITVDAEDPDGDELTFNVTGGDEGTVEQTGASTFTYTPGDDFDGDTFTIAASDPGGLFGFNRKTTTVTVAVNPEDDATEPEVTQPPTQQPDGTFEAELQFDPEKVTDVTIAEGFEPKYWTVEKVYNEATGELELKLTPTQAGQLRAALGLDTTDTVGLEVTTTETATVQTFALRSASFAALAEEPDYTLNLPEIPAGHFATRAPIVTSPDAEDPTQTFPAGTVVTDRYAYVLNSNLTNSGNSPTVSVIGADPDKADYLQVVDEIEVDGPALLLTQAGDRLYIASSDSLQVIDTDGIDPISEADDNAVLAPIDLAEPGGIIPVASPDGKKLYVINQGSGKISVVDTDPANTATFHTVIHDFDVADPPTMVDNGDGTRTVSGQFPLSAAFNADGTRMYVVRDGQAYTQNIATGEISNFTFSGEIVTIDTTTNEVIGTPVPLEGDYGYFASSDGKYLYVPTLTMNGFDPTQDTDISQITGSVNVIDVQDPDNPVIVANLQTGNMPVNVAFSPDKSLAYVVDAGEGTVWVIDTANQEVLDLDPADGVQGLVFDAEPSAALGQVFNVIAASPDGTRLFVTNFGKGTVIPLEFVHDVV